ncbi:hypothetical protein KFZ70_04170 [Tamlana fucoidanivorans]|uniref:Uncharacterized protein n=1 Tax=Allotamlana fucoidanivorans TaxID=2583814 RepID=A0A5C4SCU5_9FLAO|nr:hypothetical protein [Tamlana fucoidanivorans]TNJ41360.1 hypothetical protein FGF67_16130 [Tamlana fucoidanivorans]
MKFIDLKDDTPKDYNTYLVLVRTVFSSKQRMVYAKWSDNGFVLTKSVLFNDEYIQGFMVE